MAKIIEEMFVVKVSKLTKDVDGDNPELVSDEVAVAAETVFQDLIKEISGKDVIVEVIKE